MKGFHRLERKARQLATGIQREFGGEVQSVDVRCWSCGVIVGRIDRHPAGSLVAGDALVSSGDHEHPWGQPSSGNVDAALARESDNGRRVSLRAARP